jgi:hypothetical protein
MSNPLTRPTLAEVEGMIHTTTYTRLPSGKAIVCELTLKNGFTAHGISQVTDLDNYDGQRGKDAALDKAKKVVWEVVALMKQNLMADQTIPNRHQELADDYQAASGGLPQLI